MNVKYDREELQKLLEEEGMTVSQCANMWGVPVWQSDKQLRAFEREGKAFRGNVVREFGPDSDGDFFERSVEAFVLIP